MVTTPGATVWRDFATAGMPGSGAHNPEKSDIRTWAAEIEAELLSTLLTTKGALVTFNGTQLVVILPGNNGQLLSADDQEDSGYAWVDDQVGGSSQGGPSVGNNSVIRINEDEIAENLTLEQRRDTMESIDVGTDTITMTAHEFVVGDKVQVDANGGTLPTGLSESTSYYVVAITADTLQLSATRGGSAVDISGAIAGSPQIYKPMNGVSAGPISIANTFTVTVPDGSTWTVA